MIYIIVGLFVSVFNGTVQAGNCDPDSLQEITISGTISIENTGTNTRYYLETDTAVYILNFGPWWYQPSTGDAVKPEDGIYVEISGGINPTNPGIFPVIIVYEIDGEFWRNPYDPLWNHFNDQFSSNSETFHQGIACGWPDSNITIETFTGIVMIDTTLVFFHYFLDTDMDGLPDYRLNFGPPWYEPPGNVSLPEEGDFIAVEGGIVHLSMYPIIIVFTIDGQLWRDSTGFGSEWIGQWMHGNHNTNLTIWSPFDTMNQICYQAGWHHNGLPGSMYCQMLELHHQNLFIHQHHNAFAGFEIACFNQNREKYMNDNQYPNGMQFNNQIRIQFHYTKTQMERYQIRNKDQIRLHYWDRATGLWVEETSIDVDTINQVVTLFTNTLKSFYLLNAEIETGIQTPVTTTENWFNVHPNPVNDGITIEFTSASNKITISLLDGGGQVVSARQMTGIPKYGTVYLSTTGLSSGLYYLRIASGTRMQSLPIAIQQ